MSDALLDAIQTRDVDRVAKLLAAGADPNEAGKSRYGGGPEYPLHAAIGELKSYGADDPGGPEPAGPIELVVLLLRHGARVKGWDVNKEGDPLLAAVSMNHIEAVRLLLAHGADPRIEDVDDITTFRRLQYAVEGGRVPDDPASQERLREIRQLLGDPASNT